MLECMDQKLVETGGESTRLDCIHQAALDPDNSEELAHATVELQRGGVLQTELLSVF